MPSLAAMLLPPPLPSPGGMAAALVGSLTRLLRAGARAGRPGPPDTNEDTEGDTNDVVGITLALLPPGSSLLAAPPVTVTVIRAWVIVVAAAVADDDAAAAMLAHFPPTHDSPPPPRVDIQTRTPCGLSGGDRGNDL